jgi:hypothetical protein
VASRDRIPLEVWILDCIFLGYPIMAKSLQWADSSFKEPYERLAISEVFLKRNRAEG